MKNSAFDKKKCMSNIYAIAKEKGVKIGVLEKEANVSAGYFSKLSKDENTVVPSAELLIATSNILGVTIDMLICAEYDGINANEKYILNFLDKMIQQTNSGVLQWSKESKKELLNVGYEYIGNCPYATHPLYDVTAMPVIGESGYPEIFNEYVYYNSRFYAEGETKIAGDGFHAPLTLDANIYVMKVENEIVQDGNSCEQYEIYIVNNGNVEPLCCSEYTCESISRQIKILYTTIMELDANLFINDKVKSVIDAFMDELPFSKTSNT